MLRHTGDAVFLISIDKGNTHFGNKVRVFTKGLFYTSPAKFTGNVQYGRENLMDTNYFGFLSRSFGHALDQSRIEGTPLRQSVRKQRTIILQDSLNQEIQVDESVTVKNTGLLAEYCLQDLQAAEQAEIKYNTIVVPRGGEYEVRLPDGSYVWMNADSEIRFPVVFTGQTRQVSLKGEAYFKVEKDSLHPFIVNVYDKLKVEVLGTEFNVQAYSGDEVVKTTLNCGKVRVMMGKEALELAPDQQAVCDLRHRRFHKIEVNANYFSAWKDGKFIFEDEPLENILNSLARWYNISVFYQNEELKNFHFTGDLERYDDFSVALRMLEKATNIRFLVTGRTVVVQII